jgi:hypothetical protein
MTDENPLRPPVTPESEPFWEGALRGELRVQRCLDTGRLLFPPRLLSPFGAHREPEWVSVSGRGSVWSFVAAHPPLLPYFNERAPYNVILVALEEDPRVRLVGNLVSGESAWPGENSGPKPRIGQLVRAVFDPPEEGIALPRWIPVEGEGA